MEMKQHKSKFRFGNNGIVFTLDAIMALIVVVIILTFANIYFFRLDKSNPSNLQIIRTGSDVMKMLDYNGSFLSYDANLINIDKKILLPKSYEMRIVVNASNGRNFDTSETIPSDRFVSSGSILMAINDQNLSNKINPAVGRYWIWAK